MNIAEGKTTRTRRQHKNTETSEQGVCVSTAFGKVQVSNASLPEGSSLVIRPEALFAANGQVNVGCRMVLVPVEGDVDEYLEITDSLSDEHGGAAA